MYITEYTEIELRLILTTIFTDYMLTYDSELLYVCSLAEQKLGKQWNNYVVALAKVIAGTKSNEKASVPTSVLIGATWQQRAQAMSTVMKIKL